ncbi:MAG TPA: hypothetical protein VGO11_01145 [Chthoniobacteraceae bacterium]|nr:hypothetical protein [Chthoniobacteraceae bacterium]
MKAAFKKVHALHCLNADSAISAQEIGGGTFSLKRIESRLYTLGRKLASVSPPTGFKRAFRFLAS